MPTAAQLYKMTDEYAQGIIGAEQFGTWFVAASLEGIPGDANAAALANKIEGLMAESSHAGWMEFDLREELAAAILPFEGSYSKHEVESSAK